MNRLMRLCASLDSCLVLLAALSVLLAAGSFLLTGERAATINTMPLFSWLLEAPAGWSWWLWLAVVLVLLLAVNTLCCSWDTVRTRWMRAGVLPLMAPQLMHAGFLLIVLAHAVSAAGGSLRQVEVAEGSVVQLPGGHLFGVSGISVIMSPMDMPSAVSGQLATGSGLTERVTIAPNHPWFSEGYGVYIKHAEAYPFRRALLEIHREPGAGMALAGALLFTAGNLALLWLRARARESEGTEATT